MKAMILAAGQGKRLRPYTEHTPKPLLKVAGKALIEYHLERLAAAGFKNIVINVAYLGEQIEKALGDGRRWQLSIRYSKELAPLETAGAIVHAASLLDEQPFLLVNADVWTDFPFECMHSRALDPHSLGHLVMVANPKHNTRGDYSLDGEGYLCNKRESAYTFSGISLINPKLVLAYAARRPAFPLSEVFQDGIKRRRLTGEVFRGQWWDIGTPQRLCELNRHLCQ